MKGYYWLSSHIPVLTLPLNVELFESLWDSYLFIPEPAFITKFSDSRAYMDIDEWSGLNTKLEKLEKTVGDLGEYSLTTEGRWLPCRNACILFGRACKREKKSVFKM